MSTCNRGAYGGWSDCVKMMGLMNGFELYDKGTEFTAAQAASLTYIRGLLANTSLSGRVGTAIPINNFENRTDDLTQTTTTLGKEYVDGKPIPKGTVYVEGSLCDYKTIQSLEGTTFGFVPYFQDGSKWLTEKTDGTLQGFSVRIATKFGLPPDDKSTSYPVYLMFNSYNEFESVTPIVPEFQFDDVITAMPGGYSMSLVTAYTAGVTRVKVTKRCDDTPVTGLTLVTNFPVIKSTAAPVVAPTVVAEIGQGVYDITIKADSAGTPADLTTLEYVTFQAQEGVVTFADYLSNELKVFGDA